MIGHELYTARPLPWGTMFWAVMAGIFLVGGAAASNPHVALASVLPACCSIALLLGWRRPFRARLTQDGVELLHARGFIPYDDIHEVLAADGRRADAEESNSFPIRLIHARGFLTIPANLNMPSDEVRAFFQSYAIPAAELRDVNPALRDYLRRQDATFGPDKVWAYHPRMQWVRPRPGRIGRILSSATLVAGGIWAACGAAAPPPQTWLAAGITAMIMGAVMLLIFVLIGLSRGGPGLRDWKRASLIISPLGIALAQGDLRGELRWEELRDVKYRPRAPTFALTPADVKAGIVLSAEGARIIILDIYHRPLQEIHERIRDYWE